MSAQIQTNLLETIESINSTLKDSGLSKKAIAKADAALHTLAAAEDISCDEAMMLSAIIETSSKGAAAIDNLIDFFKCSNVQMLLYQPVFDSLVEKCFIRSYLSLEEERKFRFTKPFLQSLMNNQKFEKQSLQKLNLPTFLSDFKSLAEERHFERLDYNIFISDIRRLVMCNEHLALCSFITKNGFLAPEYESYTIYLLMASTRAVLLGRTSFSRSMCENLIKDSAEERFLTITLDRFSKKDNPLQVFEPFISILDRLADDGYLSFTRKFCKRVLEGLKLEKEICKEDFFYGCIKCDKIEAKRLFFNPEEESQVNELAHLLKPRNFNRIQRQLKEQGYRIGFACLFYGAPGTGKTESALQLAKSTGRDVLQVDLSEIRDKYVGESEKQTKAIFSDYRDLKENSALAPILLLNEADGLLSKRFTSVGHSTDQMENTMQNIILQEMETFDGILIATTNLTCNLDLAFERRFLYKVEFHRPTADARASIWKTMISDLKPSDAKIMADEFDFTGGEIENIARKYVVSNILHNTKTDIHTLRQICRSEKLTKPDSRKPIGF